MSTSSSRGDHAFVRAPNATLIRLSVPVLFSLIAEPVTGLVDTAFVARLGAVPLAALGVGTMVLSGAFWIFNFLGIGTQTEIAQSLGGGAERRARQVNGLALVLSGLFGLGLIGAGVPASGTLATLLGADASVHEAATTYIRIRLYGAPAVLATLAAFGTLRGMQDMRTPLWIAVAVNALNIALDALLIFGWGLIPALGVAGAALASTVSQWLGAVAAVAVVLVRLGLPQRLPLHDALRLLQVGGDLFVRTGLLTLFLMLTTREATRYGAESGAAHQAIRQVWMFTALFLDAFAVSGQSLVAYFFGAGRVDRARQVASLVCAWSVGTGVVLALAMWIGTPWVEALLVPPAATGMFAYPWIVAALVQPLNALAFATDGLHWGTGDFRFLRNATAVATALGSLGLLAVSLVAPTLFWIWIVTGGWIAIRSALGALRIWPGIGRTRWHATPQPVSSPSGG